MKQQNFSKEKKNYQNRARQLFQSSNCAQSVLVTFADDCGISEEQGYQLGRSFGSGMKIGGCCGAITGGLMVIGLLGGGDAESRKFMKTMREGHGRLVNCPDLLHSGNPANQCDRLVSDAVGAVIDAFE